MRCEYAVVSGGRSRGVCRGVGAWEFVFEAAEWMDDPDAEWECVCLAVRLLGLLRFDTEEDAEPSCGEEVKIGGEMGLVSSCPNHQSHTTQPSTVAIEPHPTTAPGDTRFS